MINFRLFFEQLTSKTIAVFPGGYKPTTNGHFEALKDLLLTADRGVVFIGKSPRDGITQDQSYQIWSIYKKYLSKPVDIIKAPITPVKSTYDFVEANPSDKVLVGAGDKDEDITRFNSFIKNPDKYPNVNIVNISIKGNNISGTKSREMIASKDPNAIDYFTPPVLSQPDKNTIKQILGIV
jgi:nicotinamide mononucleotide adenylyltransferase